MESISLLIVTDQKEYGSILSRSIIHMCSRIFIKTVSKDEFFMMRKTLSASEDTRSFIDGADIILWDGREAEASYGGRIVLLSDCQSMAVKNYSCSKFCIYKYSPVQGVVSDIFDIFTFLTGRRTANISHGNIELLAFASWAGGAGCTTIAMSVAQEICRFHNKRVLYLSFEDVESTGEFMECSTGARGAGAYLYELFKPDELRLGGDRREAGCPVMESYIIRDSFGVEAFSPTAGRNPLTGLAVDELDVFMAAVTGSGRYDSVIMDLGSSLSDINVYCMELSDSICMVSKSSDRRESQYIQYLICRCGEKIMDKVTKVSNMTLKEDKRKENDKAVIRTDAIIEKSDTFLQSGEVSRIFLDGKFGSSIKQLTAIMTETA